MTSSKSSSQTAARMLAQARASIAMSRGDAESIVETLAKRASIANAQMKKRMSAAGIAAEMLSERESPIPMEMDLTSGGVGRAEMGSDDDISVDLPDEEIDLAAKVTQYAKMILPHIGLVLLLAVFTIVGAVAFHYLELPNEMERAIDKRNIYGVQARIVKKLWLNLLQTDGNLTYNNITLEQATRLVDKEFNQLYDAVFDAFKHQFVTAPDLTNRTDKVVWTLSNSIFFATTVITTIGYGNIVPTTMYGRGFCIVFALMGIPLLLVTIADIGKFLSDFLSFLYKNYRDFKRKLRRQSRRLSRNIRSRSASRSSSPEKLGGVSPDDLPPIDDDSDSDMSSEDALRIPVIMVMFVLIVYTSLGGFLFRFLEKWSYFEAFYFCFITMATVGFGDFVPTEQVYMVITMAYIIFGLALATMCIDLAGTEYIRKIHYIGTKMDDAKGAMVSGLHASEGFLKNTGYGFIKTAGGKLVAVRGRMINSDTFYMDAADLQRNILYEPLSPHVARIVKPHIGVLPEQIHDEDAFIVNNREFNQLPPKRHYYRSPNAIHRQVVAKRSEPNGLLVAPFVLKESHI